MLLHRLFNPSTRLLFGAAAMSAALFGCQKAPEEVNPNFDPEKDEVNAAFVMSVATGSSEKTKMAANSVQKANNFLGVDNAQLFLYQTGIQDKAPFVSSGDAGKFKEKYDLGAVLTPGAIDPALNATEQSNRVLQLSLPLGADAALFYGKVPNSSPGKAQGSMDFHIDQDPAATWFGVQTRIGDETNVRKYDATGRLMILAINTILATSVGHVDSYTVKGVVYTDLDPISWEQLGRQWEVNNEGSGGNPYGRTGTPTPMVELAKSMGQAYATFTHINTGAGFNEYRAGSSRAVKAMIQSLYSVIEHTAGATPLNKDEANVIRLAKAATDEVNKFYSTDWTYKNYDNIHDAVVVTGGMTEEQWNSLYSGATDLNGYPYTTYGIPEGAAQLAFDPANNTFSYVNPNKALVTPGRTFDPRKYVYPAELTYYVNSPLWVTSKSDLNVNDFPNGTGPWSNTGTGSKWTVGAWSIDKVISSTRGVAIRDNINYGVALLETNVAFTGGSIKDNRYAMTGGAESDRDIPVANTHFILRGVLIGGVHPRYGWQFVPRALTAEEAAEVIPGTSQKRFGLFDGVIYDDAIASTGVPTTSPNYTLVYDNYNYLPDSAQNDVYVALEFVNNGDAFWGRDNLIPNGGVFYLGAKLTVAPPKIGETGTQTISWPSDHQVPPINETTGASKQIPRVFIQDFLTKATFRIGTNSLKYAYYSVPDLTSSQMSFGLSVDLSWESGYEYDIEFGPNPGPTN